MSGRILSITRREAFAMWPDVQVCSDSANCIKKRPPFPSRHQHQVGFTDNWGVIHLTDLDKRVHGPGIYELCVLVALRRPEIKRLPIYHRIWKSHTWAHAEMRRTFHRLARIRWSVNARVRAWRLAERAGVLMDDNLSFYWWAYLGRKIATGKARKKARSQNRRYISDDLIAAWQADLAAGMTFGRIGKKYERDSRTVWKALVRRGLHQPNVV